MPSSKAKAPGLPPGAAIGHRRQSPLGCGHHLRSGPAVNSADCIATSGPRTASFSRALVAHCTFRRQPRQLFGLSCVLSVRESGWRAGRGFRAATTRTPQHGAFEVRINLCTVASDSGCSSVVAAAGLGRSGFGAPGEPSRDLADGVAQLLDRRRDPVASRLECRPTRGGRLGAATAEASRHRVVAGAEVEAGPDGLAACHSSRGHSSCWPD